MVKLTAQEVAELKGCGEAAIRKSIRNGKRDNSLVKDIRRLDATASNQKIWEIIRGF